MRSFFLIHLCFAFFLFFALIMASEKADVVFLLVLALMRFDIAFLSYCGCECDV